MSLPVVFSSSNLSIFAAQVVNFGETCFSPVVKKTLAHVQPSPQPKKKVNAVKSFDTIFVRQLRNVR